MMTSGSTDIAGWKTVDDWTGLRTQLLAAANDSLWTTAFKDFFLSRLSLRYLNPIKVLQENGTFQGEGFSIVAIQCALIEFLESTLQGRSYRYPRKGDPPVGPNPV